MQRARHRGLHLASVALAIGVHALALYVFRVPVSEAPILSSIEADFRASTVRADRPAPLRPPLERASSATNPGAPTPLPSPAMSPLAPLDRTIPPTVLYRLREAPVPLTLGPVGIERKRAIIDPKRITVARAESLLASRIASLPGVEPKPRSRVDLTEGGGVAVSIPWPGFLPHDLNDEVWREERCRNRRDRDDDKPGETAGRRAQCD